MLLKLKALGAGFNFAPDDSGGGGSSSAGNESDTQTEAKQKDASQDGKGDSATTSSEGGDKSAEGDKGQDDKPPSLDDLPEYWRTHIKDLRDENKNRRKEVDDIKKDSQRQKDAALEEQGNFKQLYEEAKPRLDELEAKSEQFERYQEAFKTLFENAIKNVPQHIQTLLAEKDPLDALTWIQENHDSLNQPDKQDIDAGKKGGGNKNAYVGSEEHKNKLRERIHIPGR